MSEPFDPKLQSGISELRRRFGVAGLGILEQKRLWPGRTVTFFVVGKADRQTDIVLSDQFISDLPKSKEFQAAVDSYASAITARIKCGSPELFYCVSEISISVEIQWPVQSGVSGSTFATVFLVDVIDQTDGKIAKCAVDLVRGFGSNATPFYEVQRVVNRVRAAVDENKLNFYDVGAHIEQFQRIKPDDRETLSTRTQAQIERYLAGKAYFMGFRAVTVPGEVWVADPWDADYLGVSLKDLSQAAYVLRARSLVQLDTTLTFARPADKLVTEGWPAALGAASEAERPAKLSLSNLPKKDELITDAAKLLKREAGLALLVIDLDNFKAVNDTKGHPEGDACLERVVKAIGGVLGRKGTLYRWGGDEFAVTLPDFSTEEAVATAERVRRAVEETKPGHDIPVTTSIGVSASDRMSSTTAEELLAAADKAMYVSKDQGKNRVKSWPVPQRLTG